MLGRGDEKDQFTNFWFREGVNKKNTKGQFKVNDPLYFELNRFDKFLCDCLRDIGNDSVCPSITLCVKLVIYLICFFSACHFLKIK